MPPYRKAAPTITGDRLLGTKAVLHEEGTLSLNGQLQHTCCIVKLGRSFLRCVITLSMAARELHPGIWLTKGFRSDLQWWHRFLPSWNSAGMMLAVARCGFVATVTSDASGSWGCEAFTSTGEWFQLKWSDHWQERQITVKETAASGFEQSNMGLCGDKPSFFPRATMHFSACTGLRIIRGWSFQPTASTQPR